MLFERVRAGDPTALSLRAAAEMGVWLYLVPGLADGVSHVVPQVALIPLFVVWFGYGPGPKLLAVTVMAFFPVFASTVLGLRSMSPATPM